MGTVRWDAAAYGRNRGSAAGTVIGEFYKSGNTTTSTTAGNLTDGAAGSGDEITFPVGFVLHIVCDELARVVLGGGTATTTSGFLLQPDIAREIEITDSGKVSVIDEA
jgi:hypothetical protein